MLTKDQILNIISTELSMAAGGNENDSIEASRQAALATYLGQKNGTEVEGRSSVVSTDVADAIEWIMPDIVKSFTQNNEVVTFDATYDGDEKQAELESKYVYDILMKDNNGFLVLHQFIKDALLQKNGFIKVYYERDAEETTEEYTGLNEIELQMVLADPEVELLEMTQSEYEGIPVADIKVKRSCVNDKVVVVSVPPEEFRVNKMHNSIDLSAARFTAQVFLKTAGDLRAEGYSAEVIDSIPSSTLNDQNREYRFYMQGESIQPEGSVGLDASQRLLEISECFLSIDINEDGKPLFMKVTVAGGDEPTEILEMEEVSGNPFISSTAILMSHKLFGLSIYDRLKEIQDQKTSLWRNILDNMYLQNNQRTIVVENQVNLDDLLVSRPGGIIRAKRLDAVSPYQTPPLPSDAYRMMDYLDKVAAGRSGVSPDGAVTDNMIGDRVGSEGVEKMLNQKEELVGLMVRVIAETGVKPLCYKIRSEVMKHQDVVKDYKFRGQWVKVNPKNWRKRSNTTVRVGTGSGDRKAQQNAISQLMMVQEKMLSNPQQSLVTEQQIYSALDDFAKCSGLTSASPYFLDPESPEGQQNKQAVSEQNKQAQQQEQKIQEMEQQFKTKLADSESTKAQATMANVQLKAKIDSQKNQLTLQKQEADANEAMLKQQLARAEALISSSEKDEELEYKYWHSKEQFKIQRDQINKNNKEVDDE